MSSFMTGGSPLTPRAARLPSDDAKQGPDVLGRFGPFGGRFVPETLMNALDAAYRGLRRGQVRSPVSAAAQ